MPFHALLPRTVTGYDTLDMAQRSTPLTYVGDIQKMPMVPTDAYDTALCLETLEHVPDPAAAVREIYRVLAKSGTAIVTVPHLSRLHDEPHDYYRFTIHGLRHLFAAAGFEVLEIEPKGGLFAFLGHQASTVFMSLLWQVWPLRRVAWTLNKWLITLPSAGLDHLLGGAKVTPLGYMVIARKPAVLRGQEPAA
jgi:SAM-dependent methyltransferase